MYNFKELFASLNIARALDLFHHADELVSEYTWIKAALCFWARRNLDKEGFERFARQARIAPNTAWQYATCFAFFWNDEEEVLTTYAIPFVHHLEVVRCPRLNSEEKHKLLQIAESENWTLERLRVYLQTGEDAHAVEERILKSISRHIQSEERAKWFLLQLVQLLESRGFRWEEWLFSKAITGTVTPKKSKEAEVWDTQRIGALELVVDGLAETSDTITVGDVSGEIEANES